MKALIIEDDKILSYTIFQCIKDSFKVDQAYDGEQGLYMAEQNIYDIILLDLMMPQMNGYEVLENIRKAKIKTPVLILTAMDELQDKIKGLRIGADDYLVKPFDRGELMARIEAIVRRNVGEYAQDVINFKDLQMHLQIRKVTINDKEVNLQGKQFDMLEYLINYKNKILTKNQIFDRIWGFDSETTINVVEVYASGIRKALKEFDYDKYLITIRGIGYMLMGDET